MISVEYHHISQVGQDFLDENFGNSVQSPLTNWTYKDQYYVAYFLLPHWGGFFIHWSRNAH